MATAALSRADLLRMLVQHDVASGDRMARFCQLQRRVPSTLIIDVPSIESELVYVPAPQVQTEVPTSVAPRTPLRCARQFQVWSQPLPPQDNPSLGLMPLKPAELSAPSDTKEPNKTPLLRIPQYWPALRQSLQTQFAFDIDWSALARQLAEELRLEPLPRLQEALWAAPLWLIWDAAERLMPFESDFAALFQVLKRLRGAADLRLVTLHNDFQWTYWRGGRSLRLHKLPRLTPGARICLLSDLGALAGNAAIEQRWLHLIRDWRSQGATVVAWSPSAPGQVHAGLTQLAAIRHLSQVGRLRTTRRGWRNAAQRAEQHQRLDRQAQRLLTLASCALHVAPELLRELRLLDPTLQHAPGAEAVAWCSPHVGRSLQSRPLNAEFLPQFRAAFSGLPVPLQQLVAECIQRMHMTRGRSTAWLEQVIWQCHSATAAHSAQSQTAVAQARSALRRLFHAGAGAELQQNLASVAFDIQRTQQFDAQWWAAEADWASKLVALADAHTVPAGLEGANALDAHAMGPVRGCYLAQKGDALWLMPALDNARTCQCLSADFDTDLLLLESGDGNSTQALLKISAQRAPCRIAALGALKIYVRGAKFELAEIPRPSWAQEFGHDHSGVYALTPPLAGIQAKFRVVNSTQASVASAFLMADQSERRIEFQRGQVTCRLGFDLAYGAFAEVQIGQAVQRFRWIWPGEFWMGSPKHEAGRENGEGPRHRVRLSQGFWLADTACTQAMWQAVRSENPSHFQGDGQRPVEQVNWLDAQNLFEELVQLGLGGADLPTEAEWEYACRADTGTPFHFGDQINTSQANYAVRSPDVGGVKSEHRRQTVPVKDLPANAWGLYQMHGNVLEWCKDRRRAYLARSEVEVDPNGRPARYSGRAVRGGSWLSFESNSRSAFRDQVSPGYRSRNLGLRVVLRSTSPAAEPQEDKPAEQARDFSLDQS